ncbi:hypothetical protein Kpol_1019p15 [Vanderwaltozyma polyspora DSM 70294]|uniref:SPIN90/Ldb17 leucine-rich domain-containing protein n=1 Tax=Vanderwaltozyma polyspora (strain ATCC 22028 / DSM 70294 / BCRC 21397 / CBS 2163 / NBRC 10782 / NRRL Y-8283 / UCD 57-17) TaxID=436907 RepID=A7TPA8_VANPO|nr:uncharacterized protein Kpol_1019p15 [Vanderwaltozyma polyspora DSM 70294]EDO15895.1 hypothetical protein Kpol_1019p15 [Vanderwaltozyma polyspora DSM 70294]
MNFQQESIYDAGQPYTTCCDDNEKYELDNGLNLSCIEFWDKLEAIITLEEGDDANNETLINSKLVNYVKFATDSYRTFIKADRDLYRMALILTESKCFKDNKEFCLSKLLSLLNIDLLEMNMKFLIAYILLWESKSNLSSIELILKYQGFSVFYNTLYTQFAYLNKYGQTIQRDDDIELNIINEMKEISIFLLDIFFQILKYSKFKISNLTIIDDFFIHYLICSIQPDDLSDLFNVAKFKFLLALNEQYMIITKKKYDNDNNSNNNQNIENKIYKYLIDYSSSKNFTEFLLLKFNREDDRSLLIMMCKVLYLILTSTQNDIAQNYFYLNDLNVFVDVLIRELQNISESDELLRNTLLRVLLPLLTNTEISKTHYRKDDLIKLLEFLSSIDNICGSENITREHETTVRLANRCLRKVAWLDYYLNDSNNPSDSDSLLSKKSLPITTQLQSSTRTSSSPSSFSKEKIMNSIYISSENSSTDSFERRKAKPLPPPPPPKPRGISRINSNK